MRTNPIKVYIIALLLPSIIASGQNEIAWKSIPGRDIKDANWQDLVSKPDVTFNEVRKSFYKEWNGKEYQAHKGFKDFKRMEFEMAGQYDIAYTQRHQFLSKRKNTKQLKSNANWMLLGPQSPPFGNNEGIGRINDIEFHPTNQNTIYVSAPNGGVWKTENGCDSWTNLSSSFDSETILDIEIDSSNPNTLYACSSAGLYRSQNSGATWTKLSTQSFRRFELVPNTTIAYALTYYEAYRSIDGGQTWSQITTLGFGSTFQKYDIAFKPNDYNTVYISRQGGIIKSIDGGQSFSIINTPFDESQVRMVYLSTSADNNNALYCSAADLQRDLFGVFKSPDGGNSWNQIMSLSDSIKGVDGTAAGIVSGYFWGYSDIPIRVNPNDQDEIHIGNVSLFRSQNGGQNWVNVSSHQYDGGSVHVDMMDVKYHPVTNKTYAGCDGGLYRHDVDGEIWKRLNDDLPVTQIYRSSVSQRVTGKHIIGNQDNGVMKLENTNWSFERVGDGMESYIFEYDPDVLISETQYGNFRISKNNGATWDNMVNRTITSESASWTAPLAVHPNLEFTILTGYQSVWMSKDQGQNWANISGVLSPTGRTLVHIDISSFNPDYIVAATYSNIFISTNAGATWNTVSQKPSGSIRSIKWSRNNNNLILTTNNEIHKTSDLGVTWAYFSQGLPPGSESYYDLEVYDNSPQEYYLAGFGTVYHRTDQTDWSPYYNNLPKTPVYDLVIDYIEGNIIAATYGRGLWQSTLKNQSSTACINFEIPEIFQASEITNCGEGTSITAKPSPTGLYQWYKDGTPIPGADKQHLPITTHGTYHLFYPDNSGASCRRFASAPITVSQDCRFSSCTDFNPQTDLGSGYPTIIQIQAEYPTVNQSQEICITAKGDLSASFETFSIYNEDDILLGTTNFDFDCGKYVPEFCFTISQSMYNQWTADGVITITLRPTSTGINPTLCDTNEACATINISPIMQGTNCNNNWNLYDNITGIYDRSQNIKVTNGFVGGLNTSILKAEESIILDPSFEAHLGATLELNIEDCN